MQITDTSAVLDREQLRDITLNDEELMREILAALIDDTMRQIRLIESAIEEKDPQKTMRLAHYSKGACANVGANAAAALLKHIESEASKGDFPECGISLAALAFEVDKLRQVAV